MKKLMGMILVVALAVVSTGCSEPKPPAAKPSNMTPAPVPSTTPSPMPTPTPGDKPADEKPADEKPADEKPADEKPAEENK